MCGGEKVGQMPYLCPTGRSATAWDLSCHPSRSVPLILVWIQQIRYLYFSFGGKRFKWAHNGLQYFTYQSLTDKVYKWTFYIRGSPGFADIRGSQSCQMEDGSLGFADISGSQAQLCLWLRNVNMEVGAARERWCGVIEFLAPWSWNLPAVTKHV